MSRLQSLCAIIVFFLAACAAPVHNQADIDRVTNDIKMANEGDRDAAYRVCDNYYRLLQTVYARRDLVDTAWYWCSNLAKENNPAAQYRAGIILWTYDSSYGHQYFKPVTDVYVEGLYWLEQAANNNYPGALERYQYYKNFWDKEYGAGRSSNGLFGKLIAGAFIAGVGVSANASAATTAAAVGAFAADASTNGRAGASARLLQNAQGPSQLPPRKVALPIAEVTPIPIQKAAMKDVLSPAVQKTQVAKSTSAEKKQEADVRQRGEVAQAQPAESPRRGEAAARQHGDEAPATIPVSEKKPSTSINTGRRAMECVQVSREKDDLRFVNTCAKQIFVVWCGDLKYSRQHCGDGPGHSFYTHSVNISSGDSQYARGIGKYQYAACEGGIGFGKEEIKDRPDGSFTCVPK